MPSAIDSQLGDKTENKTNTAERRIDFQWNLATNMGVLYLGNNGKLTMDATGSVKVTKEVKADEGLNPSADTAFTMKFELAGNNVNANAEYKYTVTGTEETKTIKNGGTFTLKNDETAEIKGLPVGSTYTITEQDLPAGYRQTSITGGGTGAVTAGTAQEVKVTNTYEPEEITVDPNNDDTNYPFRAEKILQGRDWRGSDTFTFQLQAVTPGAPLPAGATESNIIRYSECMIKGPSQGATDGTSVPITFGSVTFTKPGIYEYDITEVIPTNKIPGVSYDSSFYRVTVTIVDNGTGKLMMNQPAIEHIFGSDITTDAQIATFTNTFENEEEKLAIQATKLYRDSEDKPMQLTDGQFHFKLEAATVDEQNTPLSGNNAPMPINAASTVNNANGEVTFAPITYTLSENGGKIYYYQLTEVDEHKANIDYSTEQYLIKVEVSTDTTDATAGELLKVTPTYYRWNATESKWEPVNANELTFTNKFTGTTTAQLGVSKSISGRDYWNKDEQFTFALEAKDNAPMPTNEGGATATATESTPTPHSVKSPTQRRVFTTIPSRRRANPPVV
ncbi:DUF5979 domain-containing protein [Gemmiger formicilis]|nr:DUF5979 domain-containing protein [Gemmiger formicilis]